MSTAKNILGVIPGIQSAMVLKRNAKMLSKPKAITPKRMVKSSVGNIVDISLIGSTSKVIGGLD